MFKLVTAKDGTVWFFKHDTFGRIVGGHPTNIVTLTNSVVTLAPSVDGGMWVSTGETLCRIPPGGVSLSAPVVELPFGIYGVAALMEDRSGTLWLGTARQGLYRWHSGQLQQVEGTHHRVQTLCEDAEGNLWAGTDGAGLLKLRPRVFRVIDLAPGMPRDIVVSVCGDWVAPRGGGLGRLLPGAGLQMISTIQEISASSVVQDEVGGSWVGTAAGRLVGMAPDGSQRLSRQIGSRGTQMRVLHRDAQGNLWMGGYPNGLFLVPPGNTGPVRDLRGEGFPNQQVTAIAETGEGNIWIGTGSGELYRRQTNGFRRFGTDDGLPAFPIGCLLARAEGGFWIGSLGEGLGRWEGNRFAFVPVDAGLHDNVVTQLIQDDYGDLWVGSSRGIFRLPLVELEGVLEGRTGSLTSEHFGPSDGLLNVECSAGHQPSVWKGASGELRFATSVGVVSCNPAGLPVNKRPPTLNLEEIRVDGRWVSPRVSLTLPHRYRRLEFRYTGLSLVAPDRVLFKRRLKGLDEDWVECGRERLVTYPRLSPGRYAFEFTACNNDGLWNPEPLGLAFEVIPAFWQTGWFRGGVALLLLGLVGTTVRYISTVKMRRQLQRLEQAEALERERARIARDLHDDLGARLTQVAFLTDLAADEAVVPADMRLQLREVSHQARQAVQSLDETVWMVNPRKDSLSQLIGYIGTYAQRFFRRTPIQCRQDICANPTDRPLPGQVRHHLFFMVKEALNNVLKHSQANEVWLRISIREPLLRIVIEDNGRGFAVAESNGRGHGLESLRRRAEAADLRCVVHSRPGQGTRVILRMTLPPAGPAVRSGARPGFRE